VSRIDMHAHVLLPGYLAGLPPGFPLPPATPDLLFESMTRYEIDAAVVSTGPPGAFFGDQRRANELARAANEELSTLVRAEASKLAGLALLPLPDVDAALAEVAHALDELALDGVALFSHVAGTYLGDPALDPLFAELDRRGAYAFVHPTFPPHELPLPQHPVWLYEFPFDTTRAIANLVYSGTLERFPNLKLQLAHLGGAAPYLAHRIASLAAREPGQAGSAPAGALVYLARLYYDTGLANNAPALAATLEVTSPRHVVFGTDWPYGDLPADGADPAPGLGGLEAAVRSLVDSANAAALVPRLVAELV
jgi:6-methylsalicylate decarboxylase